MSIDGPGILQSDLAHDVYNEILDLWDAGLAITELRTRVAAYEESLADDLEKSILLPRQRHIGRLDSSLQIFQHNYRDLSTAARALRNGSRAAAKILSLPGGPP